MNNKFMVAMYRYRVAVSKGEDEALALVRAIESVSENFFEYAEIYALAKEVI